LLLRHLFQDGEEGDADRVGAGWSDVDPAKAFGCGFAAFLEGDRLDFLEDAAFEGIVFHDEIVICVIDFFEGLAFGEVSVLVAGDVVYRAFHSEAVRAEAPVDDSEGPFEGDSICSI
jgi:hypothetical protein